MRRERYEVTVIGGGVSGLSVAYELLQLRPDLARSGGLLCLEAADRPGGNIRTERDGGFTCEWGPNGFLDNVPATPALVRRLGLESRLQPAEQAAARRFIFRRGKLRRVPADPLSFLTSGVLPLPGKLRVFGEPLIPRRSADGDESVFDFASRRIGRAAASVLVDAMVSGIYSGDVRQLSLQATFPKMYRMESEHGSLFRALLARRKQARAEGAQAGGPAGPGGVLTSFSDGLQELTDALAAALGDRLRLGSPMATVSDMGRRGYRVVPLDGAPFDTRAVVLACPSHTAAGLVHTMDEELSRHMADVPSAPLAVVHFGYTDAAILSRPVGFGFLVPRGQGPRILGALWSSQIFKGRAPQGRSLITSMIGGAHDPRALALEDHELTSIVRRDLQRTMNIDVAPYFVRIFRHPHGIPQYNLGHPERLKLIARRLEQHPGLLVAGNSYHGISVNACVEEAFELAPRIVEHLGSPGAS